MRRCGTCFIQDRYTKDALQARALTALRCSATICMVAVPSCIMCDVSNPSDAAARQESIMIEGFWACMSR